MAEQSPLQFEDVPLEEARRMGRGPRMEPMLYDTLRTKIQALAGDAVRVRLGPEIRPERMKSYILRIARELNVPVTVRKVTGGVLFWRASEEDVQQAQEVGARLQKGQRRQTTRPRGRRPRGTRYGNGGSASLSIFRYILYTAVYTEIYTAARHDPHAPAIELRRFSFLR